MIKSYLRILRKRNVFLLWFGQVVSQFGDRLTQMALIGLVYRLQHGTSSFELAKIMSLAIVPVFLFSPVAGVYVDRWNKRQTMYVSDLLRALAIFMIPLFCFKFNSSVAAYILIFLSFSIGRFFIPAKMAVIPSIVENKDLFLANSLISVTAMIAAVFGLGFGGVIVERWGVKNAFFMDALTFFISGTMVFFMCVKENKRFHAKDILSLGKDALLEVKKSFGFEMREGFRYLVHSPQTRYAVKVKVILFAIIGALYTVFIVFIQEAFSTITKDLGWLAIGAGGGLFFGSLVYGRIGARFPPRRVIWLSLMFTSLWLIMFTSVLRWQPNKILAFLSCMILGFLASPIEIALNTLIHQESENAFLGRIFSSLEVVLHVAFIFFMFLASYLAEVMTPFTIIISVGIIIFSIASLNLLNDNDSSSRA